MKNIISLFLLFMALVSMAWLAQSCNKDKEETAIFNGQGVLIDNSNTAGCGFLIRLADGTWLDPVIVDDKSVIFSEGMQVAFKYHLLSEPEGLCPAGKPVRVTEITPAGCNIIEFWPSPLTGIVNEPLFLVDSFFIDGHLLKMHGAFLGGCKSHSFSMIRDGTCCDTTLTQPWDIYLFHNAQGDTCKNVYPVAYCWNLLNLTLPDTDSVRFVIHYLLPDGPRQTPFTWHYSR
jgi:hypothetical protein